MQDITMLRCPNTENEVRSFLSPLSPLSPSCRCPSPYCCLHVWSPPSSPTHDGRRPYPLPLSEPTPPGSEGPSWELSSNYETHTCVLFYLKMKNCRYTSPEPCTSQYTEYPPSILLDMRRTHPSVLLDMRRTLPSLLEYSLLPIKRNCAGVPCPDPISPSTFR